MAVPTAARLSSRISSLRVSGGTHLLEHISNFLAFVTDRRLRRRRRTTQLSPAMRRPLAIQDQELRRRHISRLHGSSQASHTATLSSSITVSSSIPGCLSKTMDSSLKLMVKFSNITCSLSTDKLHRHTVNHLRPMLNPLNNTHRLNTLVNTRLAYLSKPITLSMPIKPLHKLHGRRRTVLRIARQSHRSSR